jgi:hypothetical protein
LTAGDMPGLAREIALAKTKFKLPASARVVSVYEAGPPHTMSNIYRSLLLVIAGATQKELVRQVKYLN